jgi:hypothetical protein
MLGKNLYPRRYLIDDPKRVAAILAKLNEAY